MERDPIEAKLIEAGKSCCQARTSDSHAFNRWRYGRFVEVIAS